jgi:hypothetical protein
MTVRLYADELRCAIYEEASGGGDPIDPTSQMNRPIVDPESWLANLYFHSDLDYYGVAAYVPSVAINHPSIAGITRAAGGGTGDVSAVVNVAGQYATSDVLLYQHDLGYVPDFYGIIGGRLVPGGIPVQRQDASRMRWASIYVTSTQVRVLSFGFSSATTLDAVSVDYGAVLFREHAVVPSLPMLEIEPGSVIFGQGKFISDEPHLRASGATGTLFAVAMDRTAGVRNGGLRAWLPDGTSQDWASYNGSLTAPAFINLEIGW